MKLTPKANRVYRTVLNAIKKAKESGLKIKRGAWGDGAKSACALTCVGWRKGLALPSYVDSYTGKTMLDGGGVINAVSRELKIKPEQAWSLINGFDTTKNDIAANQAECDSLLYFNVGQRLAEKAGFPSTL